MSFGGVFAHLYCRSFEKNDPRAEAMLSLIETVTGAKLTHYVTSHGPQKVPGDRRQFVSGWLPVPVSGARSQVLCAKSGANRTISVSLTNNSRPEFNILRGDPYAGCIKIDLGGSSVFQKPLIQRFHELLTANDSFYGFIASPTLSEQLLYTKKHLAANLAHAESLRSTVGDSVGEANRKLYLREADKYVYDLESRPIRGLAPDGRAFSTGLFWINYWNDLTAADCRFPDPDRDRILEGLYEQLHGGWLVQLTQEPPDLERSGDHERIQWAFNRFGS